MQNVLGTGDRHIIEYASKSVSETEQRYSQTEREALAVVWGCKYFHLYVSGKPVTVYTDHNALISIHGNDGNSRERKQRNHTELFTVQTNRGE